MQPTAMCFSFTVRPNDSQTGLCHSASSGVRGLSGAKKHALENTATESVIPPKHRKTLRVKVKFLKHKKPCGEFGTPSVIITRRKGSFYFYKWVEVLRVKTEGNPFVGNPAPKWYCPVIAYKCNNTQ